jgi:hypothetical protein
VYATRSKKIDELKAASHHHQLYDDGSIDFYWKADTAADLALIRSAGQLIGYFTNLQKTGYVQINGNTYMHDALYITAGCALKAHAAGQRLHCWSTSVSVNGTEYQLPCKHISIFNPKSVAEIEHAVRYGSGCEWCPFYDIGNFKPKNTYIKPATIAIAQTPGNKPSLLSRIINAFK